MESVAGRLLVAAIDFGTTFSGYAFSFRHDFNLDPLKINANMAWTTGHSGGFISLKTPTTLLLKPDKTFHSFGLNAEEKYNELAENQEHFDWFYFKRFKMLLHGKLGLKRDIMISDATGNEMPAKTVFALAIDFLRGHLLKSIRDRGIDFNDDDVLWVLTIPAIWNEPAKQFIREAAVEGGISTEQLKLALEPEAASVYCKTVPLERVQQVDQECAQLGPFLPQTKYMVLDLGGGTVDITVHEVMEDGTLKELHKASGGAWGGTKVDTTYFELFSKVFGPELMHTFQRECKIEYLDMERDFELKKRSIKDEESKVSIPLPPALIEMAMADTGQTPQALIERANLADKMSFKRGRLIFTGRLMKEMFAHSIDSIIQHVKQMREQPKVKNLDRILMVGGFSESPLVRAAIKSAFADVRVVAPDDPGLAVLKGAVIFGHSPNVISSRVVRYTYGVAVQGPYNERIHPAEKKFEQNGELFCKDLFSKLVERDADVGNSESVTKEYDIIDPKAAIVIEVVASENTYPVMATLEGGCTTLGKINIPAPLGGWRSNAKLKIELGFGGTEFKVKATELLTQLEQEAIFDFLN